MMSVNVYISCLHIHNGVWLMVHGLGMIIKLYKTYKSLQTELFNVQQTLTPPGGGPQQSQRPPGYYPEWFEWRRGGVF